MVMAVTPLGVVSCVCTRSVSRSECRDLVGQMGERDIKAAGVMWLIFEACVCSGGWVGVRACVFR